jgi:hypothetical protein
MVQLPTAFWFHPFSSSRLVDGAQPGGVARIRAGFDQECGAVALARLAVYKSETEFAVDIIRWVDRNLIRLMAKFGEYQKDQVTLTAHDFR